MDDRDDNTRTVRRYDKAAGGWDALKASWDALRRQDAVRHGPGTLLRTNQPTGFDCPGCAWPDRNPHSTFEFCENGVKAVANESTARRIGADFFAEHPVSWLAQRTDEFLEAQGRLTEPLAYDAETDRYVPIDWDAAFARIAAALNAARTPDHAVFYTSGRTSNEAAFLYQLFVRAYGTNNLPDCSNMCHEASGVAMIEQLGSGKGSVLLEDFEQADAIFVFGQNPGTNHPRMLGELRRAAKRGCRIVAINPLRERGLERFTDPQSPTEMLTGGETPLATLYLQPRIGGDLAVAYGIAKIAIERADDANDPQSPDAIDRAFIDMHTDGYDAYADEIRATGWDAIERESGLRRAQIEQAADVYLSSRATIFCWGMGITQHRRSVATIQSLIALLLLRGDIGRPGAGPCPVRGHSNVQGDRTMGIYEKPSDDFLDRLGAEFGFAPPRKHGFDTVETIESMGDGQVEVFFAMGGNFAAATPDTQATWAALRNCALTVQVSTKLNRSHVVHGRDALILPCLGRTEIDQQAGGLQAVSVEDSMSMVHLSAGMNAPASKTLLSEPAIVARLAAATLPDSPIPWLALVEDYDHIRDRIARVVPGFEDFNARVHAPGGFHLRHPNRSREFPNATGKARFFAHPLIDRATMTGNGAATSMAPDRTLQLMTIRSHDQYNTTVYSSDDRYRGVRGLRRVCFVSRKDLDAHGFVDGDLVDLISVWRDGERVAEGFRLVEYDIPPGCAAAYFPETNVLVPLDHVAERAQTPASKSIPIRLRRSAVTLAT